MALFLAALSLLSVAVYIATTNNVRKVVGDELWVSGTVFENLSATRNNRLQDEAQILAHDFGFRAAVATDERATIGSALDNLATRFSISLAFVVLPDGEVIEGSAQAHATLPPSVVQAVRGQTRPSGVFTLKGQPYEIVAAPIQTPETAGWVVFASALGPDAMLALKNLSAVPLSAEVIVRPIGGRWARTGSASSLVFDPALQDTLLRAFDASNLRPQFIGSDPSALTLIEPLTVLGQGEQIALLLRCPLTDALKPYGALIATILFIGVVMIFVFIAGSWLLARTVTLPISALEDAAKRLQKGQTARVKVRSIDEIGRLGLSFNAMADDIEQRTTNLKWAKDSAETANEAKSIFLANMNHEVRTPLNGVLGVAGMLATTPLDASQRQMVDIIESSGMALNRILNDVLDMVDLGSDGLELHAQAFDLGATVRNLASTASAAAEAKGLYFRLMIEEAADHWAMGDESRIVQILTNVLDNAVKFTMDGSVQFKVSLEPGASIFRFEIRDTGVGFDQACVEDLFSPFSQADGSMTRRVGGTGLGLSLARDLARAMGGEIVGAGVLGKGSVFVLSVPLALAQADLQIVEADQGVCPEALLQAPSPAALRILLAEDHAANRRVIEMILEAIDVDLLMVENGAEALQAFKDQAFDVVLMDLQMPVMDGLTAIKLIRRHEQETGSVRTPIVVISANVQSAHIKASAEAGADRHLAKPILAPTLIAALQSVLEPGGDTEVLLACA